MSIFNFWGDVVPFSYDNITIDGTIKGLIEEYPNAINLECPIVNEEKGKISKAGPHLSCSKEEADSFFRLSDTWIVSTANNHFADYGKNGIIKSHEYFTKKRIYHFGSGENLKVAREPKFLTFNDGFKVGFLSANEIQFGSADEDKFGVAGYDEELFSHVKLVSRQCDRLVVSFHAAVENWPIPSPWIRKLYKSLIDIGVDVVWGHHSHVPQPIEKYNNSIIIYGNGNSFVNPDKWKKNAQKLSGFVCIDLEQMVIKHRVWYSILRNQNKYNIIPTHEDIQNLKLVSLMNDESLYRGVWQEIAVHLYENTFHKYLKKNYETAIRERFLSKGKVLNHDLLYHLFSCESHRQAIQTYFGLMSGELTDYRCRDSFDYFQRLEKWMK